MSNNTIHLLFLLLSIISIDTFAQPCYAIAVDDAVVDKASYFIEFDVQKEYSKYIADVDPNIKAITIDPSTGKIYTARFNEFGTLDPVTGKFEKINDLGSMDGEYGIFTPDSIRGMVFNKFEGIIHAIDYKFSNLGPIPGSEDLLFKINPTTGTIIKGSMYLEQSSIATDYAIIETVEAETNQGSGVFQPLRDVWDLTVNPDTGELFAYHRTGIYALLTIINQETGRMEQIVGDVSNKDYLGISYSKDGSSLYFTSGSSMQENPNILYEREFDGTILGDQQNAGIIDAENYLFRSIDCGFKEFLTYQPCISELEITNMMEHRTAYRAKKIINSNLYLNNNTEFFAGSSVNLFSGFEVKANTDFAAYISNCN